MSGYRQYRTARLNRTELAEERLAIARRAMELRETGLPWTTIEIRLGVGKSTLDKARKSLAKELQKGTSR